jgi:hypothetical protein
MNKDTRLLSEAYNQVQDYSNLGSRLANAIKKLTEIDPSVTALVLSALTSYAETNPSVKAAIEQAKKVIKDNRSNNELKNGLKTPTKDTWGDINS